jgi:hypothetical protein
MLRGAAGIGDVQRNVARLRGGLRLAHWNEEVRGPARCIGAFGGGWAGGRRNAASSLPQP